VEAEKVANWRERVRTRFQLSSPTRILKGPIKSDSPIGHGFSDRVCFVKKTHSQGAWRPWGGVFGEGGCRKKGLAAARLTAQCLSPLDIWGVEVNPLSQRNSSSFQGEDL